MKNALVIDGFSQKINGTQNDWGYADVLDSICFDVTAREERVWNWDAEAVQHADVVLFYNLVAFSSWGWKSIIELGRENLNCNLAIGFLPVNQPCGLCDDIVLPASVKKAIVLQETPPNAFPISKPLANAPWIAYVDLDDPAVPQADKDAFLARIAAETRININCNVLATGDAVHNHSSFSNDPRVLALARRLALEFA